MDQHVMGFNSKTTYFILATLLLSLFHTTGCSLDDADIVRAPPNEDIVIQRERDRRGQYDPEAEEETILGG